MLNERYDDFITTVFIIIITIAVTVKVTT